MSKVYATSKAAKSTLKKAHRDTCKSRSTAYVFLRALDHQLQLLGVPLSRFMTQGENKAPTKPLCVGE